MGRRPRVVVLGAGVVGLTAASVLLERGADVTVHADATWRESCSAAAGAVWFPILAGDPSKTSPGYGARMERWTTTSWDRLRTLVGTDWGVGWVTNHELFRERRRPDGYLADLLPGFEACDDPDLPAGYAHRWTFRTLLLETPVYMARLLRDVQARGATFTPGRLDGIAEVEALPADVVVNCTGLGSRALFGDRTVRGIRGFQLLHAPVQLADVIVADEFSCMSRRDALALGSLFVDDDAVRLDPAAARAARERIWRTVQGWVARPGGIGIPPGILDLSRVHGLVSGVRPYREGGVRLELDPHTATPVVHNYGHGGSGFTIAWGCAAEVADICMDVAPTRPSDRAHNRKG